MNRSSRIRCYLSVNVIAAGMIGAMIIARPHEPIKAPYPPFTKMSNAASAETCRRQARVEREIATLPNHAWAGVYSEGGMGYRMSVTIAPTTGFVGYVSSCSGVEDQNYGAINELLSGRLSLHFTFANDHKALPPELIPVRWEDRYYLIPPDGMVDFCCDVNSGAAAEINPAVLHLLRRGGETKPVSGLPEVPAAYRKYLLRTPIVAHIASIEDCRRTRRDTFGERTSHVTLGVGSADGVISNLQFCARVRNVSCATTIKVIAVDAAHRSQAIITQDDDSEPEPRAGWLLYTRAAPS